MKFSIDSAPDVTALDELTDSLAGFRGNYMAQEEREMERETRVGYPLWRQSDVRAVTLRSL